MVKVRLPRLQLNSTFAIAMCASLVVTLLPQAASAGRYKSPCPLAVAPRDPGWVSIEAPEFKQASPIANMTHELGAGALAVDPGNADRMYVAGQTQLFGTSDGGCTWKELPFNVALPVVGLYYSDEAWRISDIDIARYSPDRARIYVQLDLGQGQLFGDHGMSVVLFSDDDGSTWQVLEPTQNGNLGIGRGHLIVAPSDPSTVFITRGDQVTWRLFVSHDQGATWQERTIPGIAPDVYIADQRGGNSGGSPLAVNPLNTSDLWAVATVFNTASQQLTHSLIHSVDEGKTWSVVENPVATSDVRQVWALDVDQALGQETQILISNYRNAYLSSDAGKTWSGLPFADGITDGYTDVSFGAPGFAFLISNNFVVRFDIRQSLGKVVKARSYANDDNAGGDGGGLAPSMHMPNGGLYFLAGCTHATPTWCRGIVRFSGKGV